MTKTSPTFAHTEDFGSPCCKTCHRQSEGVWHSRTVIPSGVCGEVEGLGGGPPRSSPVLPLALPVPAGPASIQFVSGIYDSSEKDMSTMTLSATLVCGLCFTSALGLCPAQVCRSFEFSYQDCPCGQRGPLATTKAQVQLQSIVAHIQSL